MALAAILVRLKKRQTFVILAANQQITNLHVKPKKMLLQQALYLCSLR